MGSLQQRISPPKEPRTRQIRYPKTKKTRTCPRLSCKICSLHGPNAQFACSAKSVAISKPWNVCSSFHQRTIARTAATWHVFGRFLVLAGSEGERLLL